MLAGVVSIRGIDGLRGEANTPPSPPPPRQEAIDSTAKKHGRISTIAPIRIAIESLCSLDPDLAILSSRAVASPRAGSATLLPTVTSGRRCSSRAAPFDGTFTRDRWILARGHGNRFMALIIEVRAFCSDPYLVLTNEVRLRKSKSV